MQDLPITLQPSKIKSFLYIFICTAFVVIGILMIDEKTGALPDTYEIPTKKLAALLNEYKAQFSTIPMA